MPDALLVTGATGFVGRHLVPMLADEGYEVRAAVRSQPALPLDPRATCVVIGDLSGTTSWDEALVGVKAVIHLAGKAHTIVDPATNPWPEYERVNTQATLGLAKACAERGVRLVFLSSVKAMGEGGEVPYTASTPCRPEGVYALSKRRAEEGIAELIASSKLEAAILRPPLVFGPGVKANFRRLLGVAAKEWPMPLGGICNLRSLVHLDSLCSACLLLATHPKAPGRTYLIKDGDLSTPDLLRALARGKARLLPIPVRLLRLAGLVFGRGQEVDRLVSSYTVDDSDLRALGWLPARPLEASLRDTARWYQEAQAR
tara:strand:+ start:1208 stop:2152 length:945 start_codon:yes stop_codon:yes gene_type:complete